MALFMFIPPLFLQFNLKLPAEVDEYYEVRAKCEAAGWKPGMVSIEGVAVSSFLSLQLILLRTNHACFISQLSYTLQGKPQDPSAAGPQRVMAQALMKRAIADIPIVTHIQKESAGMNKLYSQSMCSVKQWRAYQNAEAMVSQEVEEVRAEADEIEPGWSQVRRRFVCLSFCSSLLDLRKLTNEQPTHVFFRPSGDKRCNIIKCSSKSTRRMRRIRTNKLKSAKRLRIK